VADLLLVHVAHRRKNLAHQTCGKTLTQALRLRVRRQHRC